MESKDLHKLLERIPCRWRVQSFSKHRPLAICVPYIDARDAMTLLDKVCPGEWQDKYEQVGIRTICGIGIKVNGEWIWRYDVGSETSIEKDKGIVSDSFKRAAVKWGVGRFLYEMGTQYCPANEKKTSSNYPHVVDGSKKKVYDLTDYINNVMKDAPNMEEKKYSAYWIELADFCTSYEQQVKWYNENQGNITKFLDDSERDKLIKYLKDMKAVFFETEFIKCPNDDDKPVSRAMCEECDNKDGCPAI